MRRRRRGAGNKVMPAIVVGRDDIDHFATNNNVTAIAGALLGFYLFDATYNLNLSTARIINTDSFGLLPGWFEYGWGLMTTMVLHVSAPLGFVVASELFPTHFEMRGLWDARNRMLFLAFTFAASLFLAYEVTGLKGSIVVGISLWLFLYHMIQACHQRRFFSDLEKKRRLEEKSSEEFIEPEYYI